MYGFKGLIRLVSTYDTEDGDLIAMIGYDKNGKKRIFRHLILRFGEIVAGSNASSLGIKAGDILCKFNDVDLLAVSSLKELLGVLHGASENRRLVLARLKDNGAFSIFEVALPEGVIGAECLRRPVSDKQYFDLNTAVKQFSFNL